MGAGYARSGAGQTTRRGRGQRAAEMAVTAAASCSGWRLLTSQYGAGSRSSCTVTRTVRLR